MAKTNQPTDIFQHIDMTAGTDACWPWSGSWGGRTRDPRPYYSVEGKRYIAYRLVYELVHGVTLTADQPLLHSCDNGSKPIGCCNPAHVRIGTTQENSDDMTARQRHGLPHSVVKNIRKLLDAGRTQESIAELYGTSRETVSAIATGRIASHVAVDVVAKE